MATVRLIHLLIGVIALSGAAGAWTQDLVVVAPDAAKVEYEDARIRVVRFKMAPNTSSPMHDRPARVVIPLTANDVRITRANGNIGTTRTPAFSPAWSEPGKRAVTNLTTALENVIVELKTAAAPATAAAHPPSPPNLDYLAEPRHTWVLENQYVRVFEARIPAGETTDFHRHAFDSVTVRVSGGLVAVQRQGEPWGAATQVDAGSVSVDPDSRKPFVHRVRNDGTAEYRVILVQLLR
jgi:quercetin dioxygenase-like cupin family protein